MIGRWIAVAAIIGAAPFIMAADSKKVEAEIIGRRALFRSSDYPLDAWLRAEAGTTAIELTVNEFGRPIDCKIVQSSGHKSLDDTTCKIFSEKASFKPATENGKPVVTTVSDKVQWVLPPDHPRAIIDKPLPLPTGIAGEALTSWKCAKTFAIMGTRDPDGDAARLYMFAIPYYIGLVRGSGVTIDVATLMRMPFWFRSLEEAKETMIMCLKMAEDELRPLTAPH